MNIDWKPSHVETIDAIMMKSGSEPYRPPREVNRLKHISLDPLESIGLLSKGDSRRVDRSDIRLR